jgi:ribosomal protein S18 acetylase RimI-like enzyme
MPLDRFTIRTLTPLDVELYRNLRLEALRDTPMAFSSSYEEESLNSLDVFRSRLPNDGVSAVFAAFDGAQPVGMAGFQKNASLKSRHKGVMWGVYVAPEYRGQGIAGLLVDAVIERARRHVIVLECGVAISNPAARRIYHSRGFVPYGIELKAICIDGAYFDEELLVIEFDGVT